MNDPIGTALRIIDDVRDAVAPAVLWPATGRLSDPSLEGARSRAALGRGAIDRISKLDLGALPESLRRTLQIIRTRADAWVVQPDWYWTVFDPGGSELFAMFAPTAYGGLWSLATMTAAMRRADMSSEAARARYLAGLHDMADQIDAFVTRTRGQAERGIFMPRPQAEAAIATLTRLISDQATALAIGEARLPGESAFKREVDSITSRRVIGGLSALAAVLDGDYIGSTSDKVGLMHYPDGSEIYAELVRLHGSTSMRPGEVHALGLERMAKIREGMAAARARARFDGDDFAFRAHLDADPDWRADSAEAIGAVFQRYIDRFRPRMAEAFNLLPAADYGTRPLPDAMSGAMTFGYYEPPGPANPSGAYVFNAANLSRSNLSTIASLSYHELVPGHHLHLALQYENQALPAFRQWCMPTAYVEGWAEYSVTLAEEMGMFEHPAEQFGRLVNEAFLTSRLVVDTGLNALGWSLEQARDYMRTNSFFPETEIRSETLRYGADIPGQALAYKLGDRAIMMMREKMRKRLGDAFDIREFHDIVLGSGAMPLPILADAVDARTDALAQAIP